MSRRVSLPGADELFRNTATLSAVPSARENVEEMETTPQSAPKSKSSAVPSGREKHDEKITVYLSPDELYDLDQARLALRGDLGLAVDRGRIVRESLSIIIADLEAKGDQSIIARRLRGR